MQRSSRSSRSSIYGETDDYTNQSIVHLQCPGDSYVTRLSGQHGLVGRYRDWPELVSMQAQCSDGTVLDYPGQAHAEDVVDFTLTTETGTGFAGLTGTTVQYDAVTDSPPGWWPWIASAWRGSAGLPTIKRGMVSTIETLDAQQQTAAPPPRTPDTQTFRYECLHQGSMTGIFLAESNHGISSLQFHCGPPALLAPPVPVPVPDLPASPTVLPASLAAQAKEHDNGHTESSRTGSAAHPSSSGGPHLLTGGHKALPAASLSSSTSTTTGLAGTGSAAYGALGEIAARCNPLQVLRLTQQAEDRWLYDVIGSILVIFALALVVYIVVRCWWSGRRAIHHGPSRARLD